MSAGVVAAASSSMMWASGAGVVSGAMTTAANNGLTIAQGALQNELKAADMAASIPGSVNIPDIHAPH